MRALFSLFFLMLGLYLAGCGLFASEVPPKPVDLMLSGGTVLTPAGAIEETVVIDDGIIVYVGPMRGAANYVPDREIELDGRVVVPGMID